MLGKIENNSIRLMMYWILFWLLIGLGSLTDFYSFKLYYIIFAIIGIVSLLLISFTAFRIQVHPITLNRNKMFILILIPFLTYIPFNILLAVGGYVDPPLLFLDFGAYYNAAVRYSGGYALYTTSSQITELQSVPFANMEYLYPPIFVFIFIPFTAFGPILAGYIWGVTSILFLIWSVSKLISMYNTDLGRQETVLLYYIVISFGPVISWVKHGNMSAVLAGFLCLSAVTLRAKRDIMSGILTTFAVLVKPFYATSGAYLLRDRNRMVGAFLMVFIIISISLSIFGLEIHTNYLEVLQQGQGWGDKLPTPNKWSAGQYNPFYIFGNYRNLVRGTLVLFTAAISLYSINLKIPDEYIFALGVVIIPTAAPVTFTYALTAIIPGVIVVSLYELEAKEKIPLTFFFGALLVHIHPYTVDFFSKFGPNIYPPMNVFSPIVPILQPALWGTIILYGFILYRIIHYDSISEEASNVN